MFDSVFEKICLNAKRANSLTGAREIIASSGLHEIFGQLQDTRGDGREKFNSFEAVPGDQRDLARLLLVGEAIRPIVTLEIGSGYSSAALAHVARETEKVLEGCDFPNRNERSYVVESLDESEEYIKVTRERLPPQLAERVHFHYSTVSLTTVNGKYATLYDNFPNCLPDFIYLDGPSQLATRTTLNGFSIQPPCRMPMAADILLMEHFLEPGCVILVDGRTANARFMMANLQLSWLYHHDAEGDVHFMMLNEAPLGSVNQKKLEVRGLI